MAIPPCGTFEYVLDVPGGTKATPWMGEARVRTGVPVTGDPVVDDRLVGLRPIIEFSGNQLHLKANRRDRARVAEASIETAPQLISMLREGDQVNLVRTSCGGLALSVVHHDQLVIAAGAITSVHLGGTVEARVIWEEEQQFEPIDYLRGGATSLVEITVGTERAVISPAVASAVGGYHVWMEHGFVLGVPGTAECLSVSLPSRCGQETAISSARLLARGVRLLDA